MHLPTQCEITLQGPLLDVMKAFKTVAAEH